VKQEKTSSGALTGRQLEQQQHTPDIAAGFEER
jgi:hypothetical protein